MPQTPLGELSAQRRNGRVDWARGKEEGWEGRGREEKNGKTEDEMERKGRR